MMRRKCGPEVLKMLYESSQSCRSGAYGGELARNDLVCLVGRLSGVDEISVHREEVGEEQRVTRETLLRRGEL